MNTLNRLFGRYLTHPEAVVIACFFNPMNSPYRLQVFRRFYGTIKHLNHRITECVIGDSEPQIRGMSTSEISTPDLLWHKESILNGIIRELSAKFKYVFWVDADVLFTNRSWLTESVEKLRSGANIVQPFEYCVHLDKDESEPSFDFGAAKRSSVRNPKVWRSFASTYCASTKRAQSSNYDEHGHVGFAWGARREVLDSVSLYDRGLIGGADHIIAHAAAGHIPHPCIQNGFADDIEAVEKWSREFYKVVKGRIGYASGDLYHLWHGDIDRRQYLKRVKEFTGPAKEIKEKDANGLYKGGNQEYVKNYFRDREVGKDGNHRPRTQRTTRVIHEHRTAPQPPCNHSHSSDDGFLTSMIVAQATDSTLMGMVVGGNPLGAMVGASLGDHGKHHETAPEPTPSHHAAPEPQSNYGESHNAGHAGAENSGNFS